MDRNEFLEQMEKVLTQFHFIRTDELFVFEADLNTTHKKVEVLFSEGADITDEQEIPMPQLSIKLYTDGFYCGGVDVIGYYNDFDWLINHVTSIFER